MTWNILQLFSLSPNPFSHECQMTLQCRCYCFFDGFSAKHLEMNWGYLQLIIIVGSWMKWIYPENLKYETSLCIIHVKVYFYMEALFCILTLLSKKGMDDNRVMPNVIWARETKQYLHGISIAMKPPWCDIISPVWKHTWMNRHWFCQTMWLYV